MVTRDTGRRVRAEAARIVASLEEGGLLTLDFDGVGIIDYSCADEFLAKLLTRLIAGEYGEKYVCLSNLNASQEENIAVALEKKRLSALLANPDSTWKCLGYSETLSPADPRPGDGQGNSECQGTVHTPEPGTQHLEYTTYQPPSAAPRYSSREVHFRGGEGIHLRRPLLSSPPGDPTCLKGAGSSPEWPRPSTSSADGRRWRGCRV